MFESAYLESLQKKIPKKISCSLNQNDSNAIFERTIYLNQENKRFKHLMNSNCAEENTT